VRELLHQLRTVTQALRAGLPDLVVAWVNPAAAQAARERVRLLQVAACLGLTEDTAVEVIEAWGGYANRGGCVFPLADVQAALQARVTGGPWTPSTFYADRETRP
jgi:predicted nucleic acid-binding protein